MYRRVGVVLAALLLCCACAQPASAAAPDSRTVYLDIGIINTAAHSVDSNPSPAYKEFSASDWTYQGVTYSSAGGSSAYGGVGTSGFPWIYTRYQSAHTGSIIIPAGSKIDISIPGSTFVLRYYLTSGDGTSQYKWQTTDNGMPVRYWLSFMGVNADNQYYTIKSTYAYTSYGSAATITVPASDITDDVYAVWISARYDASDVIAISNYKPSSAALGFRFADVRYTYVPQTQINLLSGILGILQSIFDFLGSGFENIINTILSIPQTVINLFTSAMQSLFVPNDEQMQSVFDDFDNLLSDKLGAIYQVGEALTSVWDALNTTEATTTIEFPAVSIPSVGFNLPAQSVPIWPAGFAALQEPVRMGTTIIIILVWIRGLHHRLAVILGSETDVEVT